MPWGQDWWNGYVGDGLDGVNRNNPAAPLFSAPPGVGVPERVRVLTISQLGGLSERPPVTVVLEH